MGFIDTMRGEGYAVESTCRVLREQGCQVAARTYRAWRSRGPAARTLTDAQLIDAIKALCWKRDDQGVLRMSPEGLYGRRKLTAALRRQGLVVAECSVARMMGILGHQGIRRAKGIRTTIPAKNGTRAGDLLDRDFTAPAPNLKWVSDFTYVRTWAGWVYIAFIVDVFSQRVVAWHAQTTKSVDLVMTPLRMALWDRDRDGHQPVAGELICHSDAGAQYTALTFTEHLGLEGIRPSVGSVGDAYALMETINGLYKTECIRTTVFHPGAYKTITDVEWATAGWVDWYNHSRLHSSIGMVPPAEYEQAHYAAHEPVDSIK